MGCEHARSAQWQGHSRHLQVHMLAACYLATALSFTLSSSHYYLHVLSLPLIPTYLMSFLFLSLLLPHVLFFSSSYHLSDFIFLIPSSSLSTPSMSFLLILS